MNASDAADFDFLILVLGMLATVLNGQTHRDTAGLGLQRFRRDVAFTQPDVLQSVDFSFCAITCGIQAYVPLVPTRWSRLTSPSTP